MTKRMLRLYRFELAKVLRWKYLYISILFAVIGCILASVVPEHLHNDRNAELTGYTLAAIISNFAVNPVGLLLAIFFGALVVGQEFQHRTLPNIVAMPLRRFEIMLAKFAVVATYVLFLVFFIFVCSMLLTWMLHGFEVMQIDMRTVKSLSSTWHHFMYSALFSVEPILAATAVVMLLTLLFESAAIAISVTIVGGILLQLLDLFDLSFVFTLTRYIGKPTSLLLNMGEGIHVEWWSELTSMHIVSGVYAFLSLGLMLVVISRRDVT